MDFRFVIALWAASLAPLASFLALRQGLDRGLIWSIRFGIALLYLTPFVVTADTFFPFILGKALATRGLIEIIFGMWVVLAVRRAEYRPRGSWLVLAFAAFV
ncbi:MAG: hypothetical protein HY678_02370, partial [Chloroflexi bacterium]|nr:hypothetical protein [Chloroflexota bacterium]